MMYQSKYADLQVMIRPESPIYHHATGVQTGSIKRLVVNFGHHSGEFNMENPLTGAMERHAVIHGHFYDTDVGAERNGWTPEEKESVEITLDRLCEWQPFLIAKVELHGDLNVTENIEPVPPWPTYNETHHNTIPVLAKQLGLEDQVIAYEQANKNRPGIINALTEAEVPAAEGEMITL